MDPHTFNEADDIVDKISDMVDSVLESDQLAKLRQALIEISKTIGPRYAVNFNITLDVSDEQREIPLPFLNTGLSSSENSELYRTWGDSTPQRYIVNGEIQMVPHDRCPKCWGDWGFKYKNHSCPNCGIILGHDCKILLDSDVCPHCENGTVSMSDPKCNQCGEVVDLKFVTWG